jgi:glycosyltransferase involved in cell wall biosynthesis
VTPARGPRRLPRTPPRAIAVATHPIQYHAPWFRALAQETSIDLSVLFIQQPDPQQQGQGFGVAFEWDIPLLEGYRWQQVPDLRGRGGLRGFFAARIAHPIALLREHDPDVLLLTGWQAWPLVQLLIAAWWTGVPVLMRGESNALRCRPWYVRALHKFLLARCTAFLPIGKASHAFYRGYAVPESRLFDTPYFVDNTRFAEGAARAITQRRELRSRWTIPQDVFCFCYAGKLEPKKRILDLLAALRLARGNGAAPMHLLVVGTGELMTQARAIVAKHDLPVSFTGFLNQSEIPAAYAVTDCLVLPSDYGETWGLVVNEAMACGRPAIVSDRVGCASDLVSEGVTGTTFPFGDTAALAECLVRFASHPEQARTMGLRARERVQGEYSVEQSAAGTLRAIRSVIGV